jgi:TctA family transporter
MGRAISRGPFADLNGNLGGTVLDTILAGLAHLGTWSYWGAVVGGVLISAAIGLLPGVGTPIVMAMLIPFVIFSIQDPMIGIILLATIAGVSNTLDSIPAILMGYPGAATQVTFFEGTQLAKQGKAAHTLGAVYSVSAVGGVVGAIVMVIVIPIIRPFILNFSFSEIAAMALFGVTMVSILSRGAMLKGLTAGCIGILFGQVGSHYGTATERYTFDVLALVEGLPIIAVTLGIFALPEVLDLSATRQPLAPPNAKISNREVFAGAIEGLKRWRVTIRHSLIGVFFGMVPGIGSAVIDWLSYAVGIALTKDKSQFGKGSLDGVIFAESANNSKEGGQAIPTLAFGVPGGLAWVFVLAAMIAYGIAPGPQMLGRYADVTIMMAVSFGIGNLLITLMGIAMTGQLAKVTLIPYAVIGAIIIPISFLSAFQESEGWFGIIILCVFTPLGLAMKAFGWPRPPLVLGFILGGIIERNLQSAISAYGPSDLLTRPITLVLLATTAITIYFVMRSTKASDEVLAGLPTGAADALAETAPPAAPSLKFSLRGPWRIEHWFTLFVFVVVSWMMWEAMQWHPRARFMPLLVGIPIICLTAYMLLFMRSTVQGQIMDIGLRSMNSVGAGKAGLIIAGSVVLFLLGVATIGLQWASIVYGFIFPLVMCTGRTAWISAPISAAFVALMALGMLDYYMGVFWPDPFIWKWIAQLF